MEYVQSWKELTGVKAIIAWIIPLAHTLWVVSNVNLEKKSFSVLTLQVVMVIRKLLSVMNNLPLPVHLKARQYPTVKLTSQWQVVAFLLLHRSVLSAMMALNLSNWMDFHCPFALFRSKDVSFTILKTPFTAQYATRVTPTIVKPRPVKPLVVR